MKNSLIRIDKILLKNSKTNSLFLGFGLVEKRKRKRIGFGTTDEKLGQVFGYQENQTRVIPHVLHLTRQGMATTNGVIDNVILRFRLCANSAIARPKKSK